MVQTEIHDFFTGLNYKYDRKFGNCTVSKLTSADIDSIVVDGQVVIRNPNQFFDLEGVNYQYVGLVIFIWFLRLGNILLI